MTNSIVPDHISPELEIVDPRREAILVCARRLFVTNGYAATPMEPIAREAGVSTATLYGFYPSKAKLFAAVIEDAAVAFSYKVEQVQLISGTARERLTYFAIAYAGFMSDRFIRSVFRLVMAERPRFRDTAIAFFERGRADFGAPVIRTLYELQTAGELQFEKASWAAGQLMGMIEHPIFFMPLVTGDEVHASRTSEHIATDAVETFMARYGVPGQASDDQG